MSRFLLLIFTTLLTACATKPEFKRVQPTEVAVVIGYEFTGSKSVDPRLASAAYFAGLLAGGLPGLVLMTGSLSINPVLRTNDAVTMVDDFNDTIYRSIEEALVAKGYKVTLLRKVPLAFEGWSSEKITETYPARIANNYQLNETELQASGADAVLYVEYRIDANITDMEQLQSMNALDLQVNHIRRQAVAFSLPPNNKLLFLSRFQCDAFLNRFSFEDTVGSVTNLDNWPVQTNRSL